ncbi:MAG TPA: glycerophosphodiester phosphodiesterase [Candidatus Pullichristensenella avicola]|nr:glycerophosphodiester phosphodiesterase [Candidatus Pullichristensenella avicola]
MWRGLAAVVLALFAAFIFCTAPSRRGRRLALPSLYAHRGLHGNGVAENTLVAFERACRAGVGIEMDVRLSADGEVVVFHDDTLARLCGRNERVDALTLAQLRALSLPGGGRIPTLAEALAAIDGRAPLLVEIKSGANLARLCARTLEQMRGYAGVWAVESFHPLAVRYFRRHAASVPRGQLVSLPDEYLGAVARAGAWALSHLLTNFLSRPDFIAYDLRMATGCAVRAQRRLYRARLAAWTVRDRVRLREALARGESVIFECDRGKAPITQEDLRF